MEGNYGCPVILDSTVEYSADRRSPRSSICTCGAGSRRSPGRPALVFQDIHLDLSGTQLGDDTAAVIPRLSTLTHLGAGGHFGWRGLMEIGKLPSLRTLNLYHGDRSDWSPQQAREYFESVRDVSVF